MDLSQSTLSPKSCEGEEALLILVHSAPDHKDFREVIRSTWAKGPHSKLVFLVGRSTSEDLNVQVHSEAEATNDILLYNKSDSYYDLTTKHIFGYRYLLDIVSFFSGILFLPYTYTLLYSSSPFSTGGLLPIVLMSNLCSNLMMMGMWTPTT